MIVSPAFAGKRYAVLGLARSGLATVDSLHASGAKLVAWDNSADARDAVADKARIADPLQTDLSGFDGVVVSPGVPINRHPIAEQARAAGVPLIGDIELFAQARGDLPEHRVVAITGTNGKSTTTALVHHIVGAAGLPTVMGGNIGVPILAQAPLAAGGVYVLELSSYQIDLTRSLASDVGLLLNITPDHLDRYDGFDAYAASKVRLFDMMDESGVAIVAGRDEKSRQALGHLRDEARIARVVDTSHAQADSDPSSWPALQGPHNLENAMAAIAVAQALRIDGRTIGRALETFPGLSHRMERLAVPGDIVFVNDSKATNPASSGPALGAFPRIHWIVGGLAKSDGLEECADNLGNVVRAYTIGEAGPMFAALLDGRVPVEPCEMMLTAVQRAAANARPGEVVLLSPACASFDQFRDFEARGDCFKCAVRSVTQTPQAAAGGGRA